MEKSQYGEVRWYATMAGGALIVVLMSFDEPSIEVEDAAPQGDIYSWRQDGA